MTEGLDIVEFYEDRVGDWRWRRLSAGNYKVVATSGEGYNHKTDCEDQAHKMFGDMVDYRELPMMTDLEVQDEGIDT